MSALGTFESPAQAFLRLGRVWAQGLMLWRKWAESEDAPKCFKGSDTAREGKQRSLSVAGAWESPKQLTCTARPTAIGQHFDNDPYMHSRMVTQSKFVAEDTTQYLLRETLFCYQIHAQAQR